MKADTNDLQGILRADRCFEVPAYQRPYVWSREAQWDPLWDDLQDTATRLGEVRVKSHAGGAKASQADKSAVPHFLGAIVVEQQATAVGEVDVRSVVDGQQRLTTVQLLLRGVLDALEESGIGGKLSKRLGKLIYNDEDIVEGERANKVLPRPTDREEFFAAMSPGAVPAHASVFAEARAFFREAAGEFLDDDHVPLDPYAAGTDQERRASLLVAALLSLMKLVVIDLEDVDDAQVIFEALNARGTALSATDLVKNLLFMRAQRRDEDATLLYEQHWKRFDRDDKWWREMVGVGHAQRARQDWLIGDWLIAETGRAISIGRLYSEFRRWLHGSDHAVAAALGQLSSYANAYEQMNGRVEGASGREALAFQRLASLNITAATPLLLWLLVQPRDRLSAPDRELAVRAVESFVIRRMANKVQTRGYGQVFAEVLKAARASDLKPGAAVIHALRADPRGYAWPSDGDLRECFKTGRYYGAGGINRSRLALLLGAIDGRLQVAAPKTEPLSIDYSALTVEHVLPQKWQTHWPTQGATEVDRLRGEQLREARVHCIGNLTLVTGALNPALSNGPWQTKREELKLHSKLILNARICQVDSWNEDVIETRGAWLADQLGEVWPGPDAPEWSL